MITQQRPRERLERVRERILQHLEALVDVTSSSNSDADRIRSMAGALRDVDAVLDGYAVKHHESRW